MKGSKMNTLHENTSHVHMTLPRVHINWSSHALAIQLLLASFNMSAFLGWSETLNQFRQVEHAPITKKRSLKKLTADDTLISPSEHCALVHNLSCKSQHYLAHRQLVHSRYSQRSPRCAFFYFLINVIIFADEKMTSVGNRKLGQSSMWWHHPYYVFHPPPFPAHQTSF